MNDNIDDRRQSDIEIAKISEGIKFIREDIAEIKNTHKDMWECFDRQNTKIGELKTDMEVVKVKSGIYGTLSGIAGGFLAGFFK